MNWVYQKTIFEPVIAQGKHMKVLFDQKVG